MIPVRRYMDEAIDRGIVKNDSELARRMGVTRQSVSAWRTGDAYPDSDQAATLAALLNKPEILAECMAARAKRPETRAVWERAAKTLSMATAFSAVAAVVLFATPTSTEAAPLLHSAIGTLCVMLSWIAAVKVTRGPALRD